MAMSGPIPAGSPRVSASGASGRRSPVFDDGVGAEVAQIAPREQAGRARRRSPRAPPTVASVWPAIAFLAQTARTWMPSATRSGFVVPPTSSSRAPPSAGQGRDAFLAPHRRLDHDARRAAACSTPGRSPGSGCGMHSPRCSRVSATPFPAPAGTTKRICCSMYSIAGLPAASGVVTANRAPRRRPGR